jgi:hypothetical protein
MKTRVEKKKERTKVQIKTTPKSTKPTNGEFYHPTNPTKRGKKLFLFYS